MGGGPKSRLFRRVREKEGLSYSVGTSYNTNNGEGSGQFVFQAIANPANAQRAPTGDDMRRFRKLLDAW